MHSEMGKQWRGQLKVSPEDFTVVEISLDGELADLAALVQDESMEDGDCEAKTEDTTLPAEQAQQQPVSSTSDAESLLKSSLPEGKGDELLAELNARHKRARLHKGHQESTSADVEEEEALTLCAPACVTKSEHAQKNWRATVHEAIATMFPCLISETEKETNSIRVKRCTRFDAIRVVYGSSLKDDDDALVSACDAMEGIQRLYRAGVTAGKKIHVIHPVPPPDSVTLPGFTDKAARTAIHQSLALSARGILKGTTVPAGETSSCIRVELQRKQARKRAYETVDQGKGNGKGTDRRCVKPRPSRPRWLRFVLCKHGVEHHEAVGKISSLLHVSPASVATAGVKDKRADTKQWCTVKAVDDIQAAAIYKRLQALSREESNADKSIRLGAIHYSAKALSIGELLGNMFSITVRHLVACHPPAAPNEQCLDSSPWRKAVEQRVAGVEQHGFVNYFGTQRVGWESQLVSPPDVGLALLKAQWGDIISMIIGDKGRDGETSQTPSTEHSSSMRRPADGGATACVAAQKAILKALQRYGQKTEDAKRRVVEDALPYAERMFFLNAYQSRLFNSMATARADADGDKHISSPRAHDMVVDGFAVPLVHGNADLLTISPVKDQPVLLSDVDLPAAIDRGAIVVLPLLGTTTLRPMGVAGKALEEALARDGLTYDEFMVFAARCKLRGAYRRFIQHPLCWQTASKSSRIKVSGCDRDVNAVNFEFALPAGSYGTVLINNIVDISEPS
eukprot:TRINITY_DN75533_c0_g1_i1.p1 TRINITY_DN75533_c0_g1~~TRINITY_DN75533_c0_g1_i1.p1  ORF type:complete len:738 (-),score=82.29 TRINITY_DN75533_c0_g1_i1:588-2801(-)